MLSQRIFRRAAILLFAMGVAVACTKKSQPAGEPAGAQAAPTADELKDKGKRTYLANCIACHNTDPLKDGATGPAVAGSSLELLQARVLNADYPPGYTPKRPTKIMVALPHLKNEIEALAAYLGALEKN